MLLMNPNPDAELNVEAIREWIAALRSGRYTPGTRAMHVAAEGTTPEKFCCLGVAADLAYRHGEVTRLTRMGAVGRLCYAYGTQQAIAYMPIELVLWYGLPSNDPFLGEVNVSVLNDGGRSHYLIANLIERHFL